MADSLMNQQNPKNPEYTGTIQPVPGERDENNQRLFPYIPSQDLVKIVNLAIYLERPLLLRGEPGCGKTQLARAVAYEFEKRYGSWSYEAWYVKSTSRARDGLYIYDAVKRLRDAQIAAARRWDEEAIKNLELEDESKYISYKELGRAFQSSRRTVVLIDEIDKADIDFPNDLLRELDQDQFTIEETGEVITAKQKPIVFITSNDEKELPDAFLRRCLFYYFQFPEKEDLVKIINAHFSTSQEQPAKDLVDAAVDRFLKLRADMEGLQDTRKKVSTSELIDWFRTLTQEDQNKVLNKMNGKLPREYGSVLLKNWEDHLRYVDLNREKDQDK
ncbi:MAG: AAA family ATPase [Xenococcus sp. (in: cyanobacteria)]